MLEVSPTKSKVVRSEQRENAATGSVGQGARSTKGAALPVCPCCRQEWAEAPNFAVDLNTNTLLVNEQLIKVLPQVAEVAAVLHRKRRIVSVEELANGLWGGQEGPETGHGIVKTQICRLRRALEGTGYRVRTVPRRGYHLMEEVSQ